MGGTVEDLAVIGQDRTLSRAHSADCWDSPTSYTHQPRAPLAMLRSFIVGVSLRIEQ